MDMAFAVRRLQELGRKARVPLFMRFIDLQKAYDSVDLTLLWQVLARSLWSTAAEYKGDPPIPRRDEGIYAE